MNMVGGLKRGAGMIRITIFYYFGGRALTII
jgi:hypothetical protein